MTSLAPQKIAYTREEAAAALGISVYKVAAAVRDNTLPAKRNGKDILIAGTDLIDWFNSWETA